MGPEWFQWPLDGRSRLVRLPAVKASKEASYALLGDGDSVSQIRLKELYLGGPWD